MNLNPSVTKHDRNEDIYDEDLIIEIQGDGPDLGLAWMGNFLVQYRRRDYEVVTLKQAVMLFAEFETKLGANSTRTISTTRAHAPSFWGKVAAKLK